jgi:TM2 domain-containing membrane protein YozV
MLPARLHITFAFLLLFVCKINADDSGTETKALIEPVELTISCIGLTDNFYVPDITKLPPPEFMQKLFRTNKQKNKKLIAALLSFPFPFGIVGLHRIYLGTSPHVPIVYIGTLGGGFGLIPLIDFFVILFTKDIEQFISNKKVFMWIN